MHPAIAKTFGGLSTSYYFRHLFFGLLFPLMMMVVWNSGSRPINVPAFAYILLAINTLLYPYARFVYERVVAFVVGDNVFFVNTIIVLSVRFVTMAFCWSAAIFMAPIGLAYLYFHHSRVSA